MFVAGSRVLVLSILQGLCDSLVVGLDASRRRAGGPASDVRDVGDSPADRLTGLGSLTAGDVRSLIDAAARLSETRSNALLRSLVSDVSKLSRGLVTKDALGSYISLSG